MQIAALSDIGLKRIENQDSYFYVYNQDNDFIAVVCDGVGGEAGGKEAANTTTELIKSAFIATNQFKKPSEVKSFIIDICQKTNDIIIHNAKENPKIRNMATTIAGVVVTSVGTFVFNIGDSRVYALYDKFIQLTHDHTYERFMQEKGNIIKAEDINKLHALSNALGIYNVVDVDIVKIKEEWESLLICSDGLHNAVNDSQILETMIKHSDCYDKCLELINKAKINGGSDNITTIIIERGNRIGYTN